MKKTIEEILVENGKDVSKYRNHPTHIDVITGKSFQSDFTDSLKNKKEGDEYCSRCVNQAREGGCPIMDLHFLYGYELCNEEEHIGKKMLDHLIPPTDDGLFCDKCSMFKEKSTENEYLKHTQRLF